MHMIARSKRDSRALIRQLVAEMDDRGINQEALAELLGISQGHLSKILSGAVRPGRRTAVKARNLVGASLRGRRAADRWLSAVDEAAQRSPPFRAVVDAALRMAAAQAVRKKGTR
jgi:transcriptional regulator with XRE-family HTH domain